MRVIAIPIGANFLDHPISLPTCYTLSCRKMKLRHQEAAFIVRVGMRLLMLWKAHNSCLYVSI